MPNPQFWASGGKILSLPVLPLATENFESYSTGAISGAAMTGFSGFAAAPTVYGPSLTIGSRVCSGSASKYLALGSGNELVWPLSVGNSWTKLRIGILASIQSTSNTPTDSRLLIGTCSGQAHPFAQAPCTNALLLNFAGRLTFGSPGFPQFNFDGTNGYFSNGLGFFKNVAGTNTELVNVANGDGVFAASNGSARRSPQFYQITKGSPNYTIESYCNPSVGTDFTKAQFETTLQMSDASGLIIGGSSMQHRGTFSQPVSESGGNFDSIEIYWNKSVEIDLYEIAAYKVS